MSIKSNADLVETIRHWYLQGPTVQKITDSHVYLIEHGGLTKIGLSKNPLQRIKQIKKITNHSMRLIHEQRVVWPFDLESGLHAHFHPSRVTGEWFALTDEEVQFAIKAMDLWALVVPEFKPRWWV